MPAFDDSFDEFSDLTYRVAFRVIGDRGEADGVAQETLIRVAERWHHVEAMRPASAGRVAGQRAIDSWRRRRGPRRSEPTHPGEASVEVCSELIDALRRLPRRQGETVVLRYLADLSEQDTAGALGCTAGTVRSTHRGPSSHSAPSSTARRPEPGHVQPPRRPQPDRGRTATA